MPERRSKQNIDSLLQAVNHQLSTLNSARIDGSLRDKVLILVEVNRSVRDLGVNTLREGGIDARSARDRIRLYLLEYPNLPIEGAELEVVSGISEYGRRVRELRVEHGFQIASGKSKDPESGIELRPDQYRLVSTEPDRDAARRWHIANRIRRQSGGTSERLLQFLRENVGKVVTTEELAYVARTSRSFGRRVRELRTEHGYAVATRFTGRPDLGVGQYVLESENRVAEPHDRQIPERVQRSVYERDENTCRVCGWNRAAWTSNDPRFLELHHVEHHRHGGQNTADNLVVICSFCHDELHAGRLTFDFRGNEDG